MIGDDIYMASYCKQCSEELFGKDFEDFKGLTTKEHTDQDMAALALCEGCGYIQVDTEGNCISEDCLKLGHKNETP